MNLVGIRRPGMEGFQGKWMFSLIMQEFIKYVGGRSQNAVT